MEAPTPYSELTAEDFAIFTRTSLLDPKASYRRGWLFAHSRNGDRRDAELMQLAQYIASCGCAAFELYGIAFRGWTQET